MLLKIGELAARTGLTVRTLHHYDELGLLSPSVRSDAGYRLYGPADVARLFRILALRQLGLPLTDIGASLASEGTALPALIERQMQALDAKIAEATALRDRLARLHATMTRGTEPELADWLTTLELMTMYDNYFTKEEQDALLRRKSDPAVAATRQTWPALIEEARRLMRAGTPADDPAAIELATRWSELVRQFTGDDPNLQIKSAQMVRGETRFHAQTGIDPAMLDFVTRALAAKRLTIYARYLDAEAMARMRAHYGRNPDGWLPLIAEVRAMMRAGIPPDSAEAGAAAERWEALTCEFAGSDPATRHKLRLAFEQHPDELTRTGVDSAMLEFIRAAGCDAVC